MKEFIRLLQYQVQQAQRPAHEIILDDQQVMDILKISKRKLQYLKANNEIPYHLPASGNRSYYLLSDILHWMKKGRIDSIDDNLKIR